MIQINNYIQTSTAQAFVLIVSLTTINEIPLIIKLRFPTNYYKAINYTYCMLPFKARSITIGAVLR